MVCYAMLCFFFQKKVNGLNQGRMNMEFWTQLLSEWSCIPNALALVSLGATIAIPKISDLSNLQKFIDFTVPILAIVATLVQTAGTTVGARVLGTSVDSDEYMQAREKWASVQFFLGMGFGISKEGWQNDVLQLASKNTQYKPEFQKCLYADIMPLQRWYLHETKRLNNSKVCCGFFFFWFGVFFFYCFCLYVCLFAMYVCAYVWCVCRDMLRIAVFCVFLCMYGFFLFEERR